MAETPLITTAIEAALQAASAALVERRKEGMDLGNDPQDKLHTDVACGETIFSWRRKRTAAPSPARMWQHSR